MRLSDLLREPDFKKAGIEVIGKWKTVKGSYVVVGPAGQPAAFTLLAAVIFLPCASLRP